jgi:hypothetical protein
MSAAFSSKSDAQVKADRDSVEMMKRDHLWPHVTLPLKRIKDGMLETAVLCNPGPPWILLEGTTIWGALGDEPNENEYDSAEAIVAAGWVVD